MNTWAKIVEFIRRWIDNALQGTYDHFWCHLPGKRDWLTKIMLRLFYTGIEMDEDDLKSLRVLKKNGIVVYATKYRSLFEFLFFQTRYAEKHAPYPEIAFDRRLVLGQPIEKVFRIILGYFDHLFRFRAVHNPYKSHFFRNQLLAGKSALVPMVSAKGFYRRYVKARPDPLAYLLRMQMDIERPIYVVPHFILFGTKPPRSRHGMIFGSEEKPGRIKRLVTLFQTPEKVLVEMSEPINLREFIDIPNHRNRTIEFLSYALRQEVIDRINQHRRAVVGPVLKSQNELRETVLGSERFRIYLQERAIAKGKRVQTFHKEADSYLDEIAAKYDSNMLAFLAGIVRWLTETMFDGVDMDREGLKKYKRASQKGPVILIPCHKSHIDYLILSYMLYVNNLPCPLIAAGKNLSFWPVGSIFRSCGAFFIRRTFKGAALYSRVFSEYINRLLAEGFNIEFFIEGGRSRTGKLVLPKFGLLSIILSAYRDGACRNLHFVPIHIGYDRILEEGEYLHEIEGGKKEKESLSGLVKARKVLKKRYGNIFVRFDDPIPIQDVLGAFDTPFEKMDVNEQGVVCRNLGHRIINSINRVTVVTPHALVAAAVLTAFKAEFTIDQLLDRVEFLTSHLKNRDTELSATLQDPRAAVAQALNSYVDDKFIICLQEPEDQDQEQNKETPKKQEMANQCTYTIVEKKRPNLEYYKNNCISFFIPAAMVSLSILARESLQFSVSDLYARLNELRNLFKNEFHYHADTTVEQQVRKLLKTFIDDGMITPHPTLPDTYGVTPMGMEKLGLFAGFLKNFFESYLIVLTVFSLNKAKKLDKKNRVKKFTAMGFRLHKKGELECMEAISKITFENAVSFFAAQQIHGSEDADNIEIHTQTINNYLKCIS